MLAYILRRLVLILPTLFGIMLINFVLVQFVPGDPFKDVRFLLKLCQDCLLYTSPSPRDRQKSRMPSSA